MDWDKIISEYERMFKKWPGVPFHGFPDEETEQEYFKELQSCIEKGKAMTVRQKKRFFPFEFGVPADTCI